MAGLYGIFLALQLFSLLNIHITASNRVQYKEKLKKKNPQCAPKGIWDFITFGYYLRCPKADRGAKGLYVLNLVNLGVFAILIANIIFFLVAEVRIRGILKYGFFWPVLVFLQTSVICDAIDPHKLGAKYVWRYMILPDLLGLLAAGIVYFVSWIIQAAL